MKTKLNFHKVTIGLLLFFPLMAGRTMQNGIKHSKRQRNLNIKQYVEITFDAVLLNN